MQCEKRSWYMKHRERNRKGRETERNMSERELKMRGGKYEGTDLNCAFYHLWRWSECRDYWRRTWPPKGRRFVCRLCRRVQVRSGKSSWQPPASSSDSPPSLHRDTQTEAQDEASGPWLVHLSRQPPALLLVKNRPVAFTLHRSNERNTVPSTHRASAAPGLITHLG